MNGTAVFTRRWGLTFRTGGHTWHSFRDLELLPYEAPRFGTPEPRLTRIEIPGASGRLDLSQALTGFVTYDEREGLFSYYLPGSKARREYLRSRAASLLHGQMVTVESDESPGFVWTGRLDVQDREPDYRTAADILDIRAYLDPYQTSRTTTGQDWLWDPFNFETGVIREYGALTISGSRSVTVVSSPMGGCPTFTASAAMTMTYGGRSYSLSAGENVFVDLELPHEEKEVTFAFSGTGTVKIDFTPGYL